MLLLVINFVSCDEKIKSEAISTCDQLFGGNFIKLNKKEVAYHLTNDLHCKGNYAPIGDDNNLFQGKFDKKGFKIQVENLNTLTGSIFHFKSK